MIPEQQVTSSQDHSVEGSNGEQRQERATNVHQHGHADPDRRWNEHQEGVEESAFFDEVKVVENDARGSEKC